MFDNIFSNLAWVFILLVAVIVYYVFIYRPNIKYYFKTDDLAFLSEAREIMKNSNINDTHDITEVRDERDANIIIEIVPRKKLDYLHKKPEYYPGTNKQIRFSFAWPMRKHRKGYIAIDAVNWLYGIQESGLTLSEYRKYVLQHEFMHALGYAHQECNINTTSDGVCPIMYQSTRGCPPGFKCGYQVRKIDYSKRI